MWNYSIFKRLQGRKTMEKPFLLLLMYSRRYACPLFLSSLPVWCHFIKCEVWWGSFFPCHNFHPCFPLFIALLSSFLLFLSLFGLIYLSQWVIHSDVFFVPSLIPFSLHYTLTLLYQLSFNCEKFWSLKYLHIKPMFYWLTSIRTLILRLHWNLIFACLMC